MYNLGNYIASLVGEGERERETERTCPSGGNERVHVSFRARPITADWHRLLFVEPNGGEEERNVSPLIAPIAHPYVAADVSKLSEWIRGGKCARSVPFHARARISTEIIIALVKAPISIITGIIGSPVRRAGIKL